ncbi:MAG TPA: antibiotic biosynthesis monooxygenase [Steroidobacteraceae bacterium]|nr:antibiotic biosynthesis monooxygenase [Steroidobacteraceae bacterium]
MSPRIIEGFATTPAPPYYAVIFTSQRTNVEEGYEDTGARMAELAAQQPGFLGVESVRGADGMGITVSYWSSLEAIAAWRAHGEHRAAQSSGRRKWYSHFETRVAAVARAGQGP